MKQNFKKLFLLFAVVTTIAVCFTFSSSALDATGQCGNDVSWNYDKSTGELIISGSGAMTNYYPYKQSPFVNSDIQSVVIEEGVTTIGSYAFFGCSDLQTVTIPKTVTAINEKAFEGCYNIHSIYAADAESWLSIDFDYGYDSDEECVYTSNPLCFDVDLYFNGVYVTELEIPETVTEIKPAAFYNYQNITSVTIPATVTSIGDGAFWNCISLKDIAFSEGVTAIGESAFYSCCSLESITIPGSVASIGYEAFSNCNKLESLVIENGVESIGRIAFKGCYSLKEVTVPESMNTISAEAFANCMNIEKVYAADINSWLKINFALYSVGDEYNFSSNPVFYGADLYFDGVLVTDLEIPSGVTEIKPGAFCNYACIEKIKIPASVKVIAESAFSGCKGITEVYFAGSNVQWASISIGPNNDALITSAIRFGTTVLGKTSNITAAQNTSAIKLEWAKVNGATGYRVYQQNGTSWKTLYTGTGTTYTVSKLSAGTKYTFAVKAYANVNGTTVWSDVYTTVNTATKAIAPSKVASAQNETAIKLTWTACPGATGYRIYYKSGNTWKVSISSTTATSHTYTNLKAGAKYTFAIRPYIKNGDTVVWSDYTEFMTATKPATVIAKTASASKGKITLRWNAVNGADGYQVYYKTGNGAYKLYKVYSKAGTLNFSNLKSGTKYTFVVRAGIKTSGGNIYGGYTASSVTVK